MAQPYPHDGARLTSLPVELLHNIFELLVTSDVASTRLACSMLATVGAEHLLEEVHLTYSSASFRRLGAISQHPLIPKNVKSLKVLSTRIRKYTSYDDFFVSSDSSLVLHEWSHEVQLLRMRMDIAQPVNLHQFEGAVMRYGRQSQIAFEQAQSLYLEQEDIAKSKLDLQSLTELFMNAPYLRNVDLRAFGDASNYMLPAKAVRDRNPLNAGVDQMKTICLAINAAGATVKQFTAARMGYRLGGIDPQTGSVIREALQHLHQFRLSIALYTGDEDKLDPSELHEADPEFDELFDSARRLFREKRGLYHLLSGMSHLRVLRLSFPAAETSFDDEDDTIISLHDVVGSLTWPKLRDIMLSMISTSEDELVAFLLRHRGSLRRICLNRITLLQGDWHSLFRRVAGKFPKILRVDLIGDLKSADPGNPGSVASEFALDAWIYHPGSDFDTGSDNDEEEDREVTMQKCVFATQDALERYVRDGGDFPDIGGLYNERTIPELVPDETLPRLSGLIPSLIDSDGGYDSDGSHVSLGHGGLLDFEDEFLS